MWAEMYNFGIYEDEIIMDTYVIGMIAYLVRRRIQTSALVHLSAWNHDHVTILLRPYYNKK